MSGPGDDVAAAAESVRRWVDAATWTAIGLGLAFTAVNVQAFAAAGAPVGSPGWLVAWLLDPMVSVLLLAVVRAEQVTARWQVPMGWQPVAVKWAAFAATYAMNSWAAWAGGSPAAVLLHSVPPVFVLLAAEVAPALRDRLTEAVRAAAAATAAASYGPDMETFSTPELDEQNPAHTCVVGPSGAKDAPRDEPATTTASTSGPEARSGFDPRVREVAELLAAGADVTGLQVAARHGVSPRTGRRLLADARAHLGAHSPPDRPDLHLVPACGTGSPA